MAFGKPRKLDGEDLKNYAVRTLGGRAMSAAELRQKLRMRAANPDDVEPLIETLKGYGLLNDGRLAESVAGARADSGAVGRHRVLSDLLRKRVAPKIAERAVSAAFDGKDETAMIEAFLDRKFRGKDLGALLRDRNKLASAYRRLRTAGFSGPASIRVLRKYASEAEELEGLE